MTLPVLNTARKIVFVVSGEDKHRVVREIEERIVGFQRYPAARVRAAGSTLWHIAS